MKKQNSRLTQLESLIMSAVWAMSQATVGQVQKHLAPQKPMAYNTVLTMMRILRDKGFLTSQRDGRRDIYVPLISKEQAGRGGVQDMIKRFYVGSAAALVSHLLDTEQMSADEMRAIRREVDLRLRGKPRKGTRSR